MRDDLSDFDRADHLRHVCSDVAVVELLAGEGHLKQTHDNLHERLYVVPL